jgi:hypothetical protein
MRALASRMAGSEELRNTSRKIQMLKLENALPPPGRARRAGQARRGAREKAVHDKNKVEHDSANTRSSSPTSRARS